MSPTIPQAVVGTTISFSYILLGKLLFTHCSGLVDMDRECHYAVLDGRAGTAG